MKEKTREVKREIVETLTYYEAADGTIFDYEEECRKYENSALGVLRGRVSKLIVGEKNNAWDLMGGYDDNDVVAVAMSKEEDINTILQMLYLESPHLTSEGFESKRKEIEATVLKAYEEKDVILLGINCEDEYYFINSRNNIINKLMSLDKKVTKNEVQV